MRRRTSLHSTAVVGSHESPRRGTLKSPIPVFCRNGLHCRLVCWDGNFDVSLGLAWCCPCHSEADLDRSGDDVCRGLRPPRHRILESVVNLALQHGSAHLRVKEASSVTPSQPASGLDVKSQPLREALRPAPDTINSSESKLRQVIDAIPGLVWCNLADGPNDFLNQGWHEPSSKKETGRIVTAVAAMLCGDSNSLCGVPGE
jgi:hypothetical protein